MEEDGEFQTPRNFHGLWSTDYVVTTFAAECHHEPASLSCVSMGPTRFISYLSDKVFCTVNIEFSNRQKDDFGYWQYSFTENLELHK